MKRFVILGLAVGALSLAAWAVAARSDTSGKRPDALPPLEPVRPRAPEKAVPRRIDDAEAEHLFRTVLREIRDDYVASFRGGRCGTIGPWLSGDWRNHGPQARTFARAYPELARRLVLEILDDPEAPSPDRGFALRVLSELDGWTTPRLEELLREDIERAEEYRCYTQVWLLGRRDPELRYLKVYQEECRRGNSAAFDVLARVDHPSSAAFLKALAQQPQAGYSPVAQIPDECEWTLNRLELLRAAGWRETVEKILRTPNESVYRYEELREFSWALDVARLRSLPTVLACLADRLRKMEPGEGREDRRDHVLAEFAELGGELDAAARARLRPNGFVGDAEERFLEIVRDRKYR